MVTLVALASTAAIVGGTVVAVVNAARIAAAPEAATEGGGTARMTPVAPPPPKPDDDAPSSGDGTTGDGSTGRVAPSLPTEPVVEARPVGGGVDEAFLRRWRPEADVSAAPRLLDDSRRFVPVPQERDGVPVAALVAALVADAFDPADPKWSESVGAWFAEEAQRIAAELAAPDGPFRGVVPRVIGGLDTGDRSDGVDVLVAGGGSHAIITFYLADGRAEDVEVRPITLRLPGALTGR